MAMPGRKFSASNLYRYGFNGKENDNDVKGEGNQQDYGMRIYDPRLGKFLSVDPLTQNYAFLSPYAYAENDVIRSIDLDGAEKEVKIYQYTINSDKTILITPSEEHNYYNDPHGVVAKSLVSYNNLPDNGYFQIYQFEEGLGIQTFAKYIYTDKEGKVQVATFNHEVLQETYNNLKDLLAEVDIASSVLNVIAAGALVKSELKAASSELKAVTGELKALDGETKAATTTLTTRETLAAKYAKNRPKHYQKDINKVWEDAKQADGNVYDPNTGEVLTWDKFKSRFDQWHMGHKPGHEYRTLLDKLKKGEITEEQFLKEYHNPNNYQPEAPKPNMSHKYEQKTSG